MLEIEKKKNFYISSRFCFQAQMTPRRSSSSKQPYKTHTQKYQNPSLSSSSSPLHSPMPQSPKEKKTKLFPELSLNFQNCLNSVQNVSKCPVWLLFYSKWFLLLFSTHSTWIKNGFPKNLTCCFAMWLTQMHPYPVITIPFPFFKKHLLSYAGGWWLKSQSLRVELLTFPGARGSNSGRVLPPFKGKKLNSRQVNLQNSFRVKKKENTTNTYSAIWKHDCSLKGGGLT